MCFFFSFKYLFIYFFCLYNHLCLVQTKIYKINIKHSNGKVNLVSIFLVKSYNKCTVFFLIIGNKMKYKFIYCNVYSINSNLTFALLRSIQKYSILDAQ